MEEYVLEVKGLSKTFGNVKALDKIDLKIKKGEIFGLVGANGSGKSTFMNILFGNSVIQETGGYEGKIFVDGEEVKISSTIQAMNMGIGMIHQEFILIPEMSVAENIRLTREDTYPFLRKILGNELSWIEKKADSRKSEQVLKRLGFEIDGSLLVKDISVNAKQFVEIAREISKEDLKILFLDEPTAVLNEEDSKKLLVVLRELADEGIAIVFCSHRLHETCAICDRVMVIRDGIKISDYESEQLSISSLANDMVGYDVISVKKEKAEGEQETVLIFDNVSMDMPGEKLEHVYLEVKKGEILGVTSLSGHGKLAFGYGIMGGYTKQGRIFFEGEEIHPQNIQDNIRKGLFLLPDDRKGKGLLLEHSIKDNIVFSNLYNQRDFLKKIFGNFYIRDDKAINEYVIRQIEQLDIKCVNMEQKVGQLSGGNQQKVCIARAIAVKPKVLVVMEPTRGVDVAAKEKILDMFLELNREKGTSIIVISSEIEELKRISDRIAVLCEGKISAVLPPDVSDKELALAFTGEEEYGENAI